MNIAKNILFVLLFPITVPAWLFSCFADWLFKSSKPQQPEDVKFEKSMTSKMIQATVDSERPLPAPANSKNSHEDMTARLNKGSLPSFRRHSLHARAKTYSALPTDYNSALSEIASGIINNSKHISTPQIVRWTHALFNSPNSPRIDPNNSSSVLRIHRLVYDLQTTTQVPYLTDLAGYYTSKTLLSTNIPEQAKYQIIIEFLKSNPYKTKQGIYYQQSEGNNFLAQFLESLKTCLSQKSKEISPSLEAENILTTSTAALTTTAAGAGHFDFRP
jgi:hypothetical protein